MNAIVITNSFSEVQALKPGENLMDFYGKRPKQDYDQEWYWIVKNNKVDSGSAGYNSFRSTIDRCPGFQIFQFKDYTPPHPSQEAPEQGEWMTAKQIERVIKWMNTWEQLKDTVIPIRFKEDFTDGTLK